MSLPTEVKPALCLVCPVALAMMDAGFHSVVVQSTYLISCIYDGERIDMTPGPALASYIKATDLFLSGLLSPLREATFQLTLPAARLPNSESRVVG